MENQKEEELKKMYKLFAKVGGLKVLSVSFKTYVQVRYRSLVYIPDRAEESSLESCKGYCYRYCARRRDGPTTVSFQGFLR